MMMRNLTRAIALSCIVAAPVAAQRGVKLPPRPTPPPARAPTLPKASFDSLANGLRFAVVENHELPLVVVQTAFVGQGLLGASLFDPPGKQGAWGLMLASLREGSTLRSATQIRDEVADLGTDMRFTSTVAFLPPSFRAARSTWTQSLALLADVIINPSFPTDGVDKQRSQISVTLGRLPSVTMANRLVIASLYGTASPYANFATPASLAGVTRDDVIAVQQAYLRPQNAVIVVSGDVTPAEAKAALSSAFGEWKRGGTSVRPYTALPDPPKATTIYLMDFPEQASAGVVGAQLVPGRDHSDGAEIETLAALLGDFSVSSGSRFYRAFRLERGLSYSPRVELLIRPVPELAPLVASASVPTALADTAVLTLVRVIRELKEGKPATSDELDFAKRNLVGRLGGDFERLDATASIIAAQMRDGLPPDYTSKWIGRINAQTLASVQSAAARYLDPDHLVIVVTGNRARLEPLLRGTGLPVVVVGK